MIYINKNKTSLLLGLKLLDIILKTVLILVSTVLVLKKLFIGLISLLFI